MRPCFLIPFLLGEKMSDLSEGAVSLKVLAERKVDGVGTVKQFSVASSLIEVEDGFNGRPIDVDHVEAMKKSYRAGAVFPPMYVRVDNGRIILVDGHHRDRMYKELILEGLPILKVDVVQFRGNDAERVAHMLTTASGKPLTPLEMGLQYRKLQGYGWENKRIAETVGKTVSHVGEMIKLAESNSDVQGMVKSKQVSAANAVKMLRKHGEKAGEVMADSMQAARLNGKSKITEKSIGGSTPKDFIAAIEFEMSSGGSFKAETLCPKYANLIAYLRSYNAS